MADRKKLGNKIQIAILALFIVFMPLGSWYYLQSGFNYHEKLMSELKDYGNLSGFTLITQEGDTLLNDDLRGKIMVANFYSQNASYTPKAMDYARRMLGQFKSQPDLIFLFHDLDADFHQVDDLKTFAEKEELTDSRVYFLKGEKDQVASLIKSVYKIPNLENKQEGDSITFKPVTSVPDEYPYFVLVDSSLTIRNYYDINNESSINHLVEHLAIILPREKKSKAQYIPNKEK